MNHPAFRQIDHRPWPLPNKKWTVKQVWKHLLFIHWEVDPDWMRRQLPKELELDLFDGKAWIGIVPFDMSGVTRRGFPAPRWICDFPEINVRTYVRYRDKPGVWFFSLDVPSSITAWMARTFYYLTYFKAEMSISPQGKGFVYRHQRNPYRFVASYEGHEKVSCSPDSFEIWATERYCLYSQAPSGSLYRAEVHHPKWPLQRATVTVHENTLLQGVPCGPSSDAVLFSKSIDVVVYPLERLE